MRNDLDLLQGSWTVTAVEMEGQPMPAELLANARIVIEGKRFTSSDMGAAYKGTLELLEAPNPRQLNMKFDAGPESGNTNFCIYQLDGDTLKLCIATHGVLRPSTFATTPGSGFAFETLIRSGAPKAAKTKAPASKNAAKPGSGSPPASEFEGEWRMVSGIMNGTPMDRTIVQWVKRVTRGNETTVYAGPQVMMKLEFTSDPLQSPKAIDYFNTAGPNKGKTQRGIYELDGELMTISVSEPGAARPTTFQTTPGEGGVLTLWKRA